ncbi:MAG: Na+/H+ antiporter NhaC family protein [Porphyromonas sp.]|nr:Na+/H+ antiporter NhaC family protein [Porphyromonas sp.]
MTTKKHTPNIWGLSPLLVFLIIYLVSSLILRDFYAMPLSVAFVASSVYAIATTKGLTLEERINVFNQGASNSNIITMIWIFVLAGAFAQGAKSIGAIDASVALILNLLPAYLLLPGLFLGACLISLSIGTSVGTIIALVPIALGLTESTGVSPAFLCGLVAGGAFFGDNLSFISDTTIAATRTQRVGMSDKFRVNFLITVPAAIVCLLIYAFAGTSIRDYTVPEMGSVLLILPYLAVIITALLSWNVLLVLSLGIVSCGLACLLTGQDIWMWIASLGEGIKGLNELIIVTLLAGGMLALIKQNGGLSYLLDKLERRVQSRRGGEFAIASLVILSNICTANNTIAILTSGEVAREISDKYQIDPRRTASILDTFSCMTQGLLPYGAQLLLAAGFASISPLSIVSYMYYPILLGVCTTLAIVAQYPRKFTSKPVSYNE